MSSYDTLKQRHRAIREGQPENLTLRIHRSLSWLQRAEMAEDNDGRFIFLWIAFNAAYAAEIDDDWRLSEQSTFKSFLEKLCGLDRDKRIGALVWQEFTGSIRVLLDNPYVFQSFWDFQSGRIGETDWIKRFAKGKKSASMALASGNTPTLLSVVFNRLYTLRNQLIHGGATWNSSVNRQQLQDCVGLLGKLVPLIIELMMDHPDTLWGDACYPVVRS
ncbi:HEPN domain-containing protein [Castellaniella caeni]|uniref:HEPN domain-containing protein n=1 Tax=Castellaniella caeni TaxID=266123 RepID=UPI0008296E13|nr:HEPN domain-containing protein [Castellaniella caeni]